MSTQRGMQICICFVFSAHSGCRREASFIAHSWRSMFSEALILSVSLFGLISSSTTILIAFPGGLSLPIPRTSLTGTSGHRVGNQCKRRGPRHQLLLQLYNVLHSAELLLALCPGSLVLSLHSCFSLTNSLLVPPLGMSGPFLWQLWPTVVQ